MPVRCSNLPYLKLTNIKMQNYFSNMSEFYFSGQSNFYKGKVRDVYTIYNKWLVMIASNRISAFDVILPAPIPHKGQILNQIAAYMLDKTKDICNNWMISTPTSDSAVGKLCMPFRVEMVVRGNLTGHAWRTYSSGRRLLCGVSLPEGLKENDYFPEPIITPSTKADQGHDEDISRKEIIDRGIVSREDYEIIEKYSLQLFKRGREIAAAQGLILVDTKYEFGKNNDQILLMDEIHTPDSSRYFYADGYEERQKKNEKQKQLSKEFVREWLIENDFMGKEGQVIPSMSDNWIEIISNRYVELYEILLGKKFIPNQLNENETHQKILEALFSLSQNS